MSGRVTYENYQITHRLTIMEQIQRCNKIISGFDTAPDVINAMTQQYSYEKGSHDGKSIALSIIVLLALSRSVLPLKFYTDEKINKKYKIAFEKTTYKEKGTKIVGYPYLSKDPTDQFTAILKIMDFYSSLLDAIYSLVDFSDIKNITQLKGRRNIVSIDDEDLLFEM